MNIKLKVQTIFLHMSELSYIQIERRPDAIAIITINRPEVLNAINVDVITELASAIDTVSADDGIKVVIITGRGERSFCAGADIRYVVNINPIEAEKYASSVHTMLNKIENLMIVWFTQIKTLVPELNVNLFYIIYLLIRPFKLVHD